MKKHDLIKNVLVKNNVFILLLTFVAVFGILTVLAWSTPTEAKFREIVKVYESRGSLKHEAHLVNNTLYGERLSSRYYPENLVGDIHLIYTFSSDYQDGEYEFSGDIVYKTKVGNDEYVMWTDRLFDENGKLNGGSFEVKKVLNISELNARISSVSRELSIRRLDTDITFTCFVKLGNKTFKHEITMIRDPTGLIYFKNVDKDEKSPIYADRTVKSSLNILGLKIDTGLARMAFSLPLIVLIPPFAYSSYLRIVNRPKKVKGLDKFVVDGEIANINGSIILKSEDDLKKVFEFVDKPIIKHGNEYIIVDNGIAYRYRKDQ
ncbi:hypothetical protein [Archaeoglobus profundus]|uniref:Uncharacterized protein n=1 Tax=Archaeoglobus profundus (strain DSM 5631 / JCM 9629 / NBRC 100127 / Av18) TaxID=572546 RepID=D2RHS7_ARCPA|nr:hypothetical protein [Archaeoglobus profundus]ADB57852.1 hypothetical protein Arcpr_0789 [Archaeoglobus profundus DSM 5631]